VSWPVSYCSESSANSRTIPAQTRGSLYNLFIVRMVGNWEVGFWFGRHLGVARVTARSREQ
jgi:hypothetical protein